MRADINKKKAADYRASVLILMLSPFITYLVTLAATYARGYVAVGGEVFLPFLLVAGAGYLSCRRVR